MDAISSTLIEFKGDVNSTAHYLRKDSKILVTVPHAYSVSDDIESHPRDFAALEAAKRLLGPHTLLHVGTLDRHLEADLNRETTTEASRDYHEFIDWWIRTHPDGILVDVHSFPKEDFNWKNSTTTLKRDTYATSPLVILLPEENSVFAQQLARGLTKDVYQGTSVVKIVNMGCKKSVLLEFREDEKGGLESPETADRVRDTLLAFSLVKARLARHEIVP
jgi:hypothetical protein